jgi:hypothetical protein
MKYEADVFPILNLEQLSANYRLCEIIGLNEFDEEFDNNIQYIIKNLSYSLKQPITVTTKEGKPYLVIQDSNELMNKLPQEFVVKKGDCIYFKKDGPSINLDFKNYTEDTKPIILRFLQFNIQTELNKIETLWQPSSGDAFFNKLSSDGNYQVSVSSGFIPRVVDLPNGGFGICIDVTKKYIDRNGLPTNLTRDQFRKMRLNKRHMIYKYGNRWYEIKPDEFSDLNVSQYKFTRKEDCMKVSLLQDIHDKFKNGMPPEVATIPDNASVIIYRTNTKEERRVPAALCYRVFDTEEIEIGNLHKKSIIKPFHRRRFIQIVRRKYLENLMYANIKLQIEKSPLKVEIKIIEAPDIEFRNSNILTVRNSPGAIPTTIDQLGKMRAGLLLRETVGFYTNAPFERQYLILPETVYNTYGNEKYFLKDLTQQVNKMHTSSRGWTPIIITYDNRNMQTTTDIGFEIIEQINNKIDKNYSGYAVIMLPADVERDKRQHDELAALVVSECFENNITASIMHADTLSECYYYRSENGVAKYYVKNDMQSKYRGYIRGVAINQVLLNNERWPFVLHTPLYSDLTVGIDVKRHIAGFTFIDKHSKNILTRLSKSTNKEKLSTSQIVRVLVENIILQAQHSKNVISTIIFHRDGRLFKSEKDGILQAIDILKTKSVISPNTRISIIEIPKSSIVPFRLFDVVEEFDAIVTENDNGKVLNPKIGSVVKINKREAFLCTTGREFAKDGTSNPLYIKYNYGDLEFDKILEDIYYLSCLAYTKPDDCSRFPLTIKITDRRINTLGSNYDSEALDILKYSNI